MIALAFLVIPSGPAGAQTEGHGVNVTVTDSQGTPLENVRVEMFLVQLTGGNQIRLIPSGNCQTDRAGHCFLNAPQKYRGQNGFFRGYLSVGEYGQKSLLWPGGILDVNVWIDEEGQLDIPGHEPYAWQDEGDGGLEVKEAPRLRPGDVFVLLACVGVWLGIIYWRSKS
jgi:hypothetical protein